MTRAAARGGGLRWRYLVAATVLAGSGGAGWWALERVRALEGTVGELEQQMVAYRDTLDLIAGPLASSLTIPVTTGGRLGSVTIFEDAVTRRWLVRCENLAPNEPDQTYQLWFVTDDGLRSAVTLTVDTARTMVAVVVLPGDGVRVVGAAMSIEPRTGAAEMRGPAVFREML